MSDEYTPDLIQLTDDEGNEYNFEVLDTLDTDNGSYAAMTPVGEDGEPVDEDESELIIMKVIEEEDGESYFVEIEDDDEYESIADTFVNKLRDYFEIEDK